MNLNKVMLGGNLCREVSVRQTAGGKPVSAFTVAVNRSWKSESGEEREEVTFVDCSAFGRTGEVIAQYFDKGRPILVEGRLRQENWETKDGQKRTKLSLVVEQFHFVGGNKPASDPAAPAPAAPDTEPY